MTWLSLLHVVFLGGLVVMVLGLACLGWMYDRE